MTSSDIDPRALREIRATKPAAEALFEAIRAGTLADETQASVDEVAALSGVSRRQAIDVLRALADAGAGVFKVGRKGHPSRLEWSIAPAELLVLFDAAPEHEDPVEDEGAVGAEEAEPTLELTAPPEPPQRTLDIADAAPAPARPREGGRRGDSAPPVGAEMVAHLPGRSCGALTPAGAESRVPSTGTTGRAQGAFQAIDVSVARPCLAPRSASSRPQACRWQPPCSPSWRAGPRARWRATGWPWLG